MLKQKMTIALLGVLFGFSILGYSQEQHNLDVLNAVNILKQKQGRDWVVEWNKQGSGVHRIYTKHRHWTKNSKSASPLIQENQKAVAMAFLKENANLFQLPADLGNTRVLSADNHGYVMFGQTFNGVPVFNRRIGVSFDVAGYIYNVTNNFLLNINISTTPQLSVEDVIVIAQEDTLKNRMVMINKSREKSLAVIRNPNNPFLKQPKTELIVYVTEKEEPVLAYSFDVVVSVIGGVIQTRYFIDANSGGILIAFDPNMYAFDAEGRANIFWPNPVNSLLDTTLTDEEDGKLAVPFAAYFTKPLKNILFTSGNKYFLNGPYVRPDDRIDAPFYYSVESPISSFGTLLSDSPDFFFDRESNRFEHVMVYQVIDANQRYIQLLGFDMPTNNSVNKRPIKVDPHAFDGKDESAYVPDPAGMGYLKFGEGGVDDAEDADIILHEYGHAIQDNQAPGIYSDFFCNTQTTAMSEGFGDYWQASNTRAISKANGFDPACFAEWDNADKGAMCRRRLDSTKRLSDLVGECHDDGEIWSSALWEILTKIGASEAKRKIADQLILQSHFEMKDMGITNPSFSDGGVALLKANNTLVSSGAFTRSYKNIICNALKTNRDIPVPGCK